MKSGFEIQNSTPFIQRELKQKLPGLEWNFLNLLTMLQISSFTKLLGNTGDK
jgi:hypothetical protein